MYFGDKMEQISIFCIVSQNKKCFDRTGKNRLKFNHANKWLIPYRCVWLSSLLPFMMTGQEKKLRKKHPRESFYFSRLVSISFPLTFHLELLESSEKNDSCKSLIRYWQFESAFQLAYRSLMMSMHSQKSQKLSFFPWRGNCNSHGHQHFIFVSDE